MSQKTHWPYIIASYSGLFSLGLCDNIRGPFFLDLMLSLNITDTQGSMFYAIPALVSFISSLLVKYYLPSLGSLWTLRVGILFIFASYFLMGWVDSFWQVLVLAAVFGAGFGQISVAQHTAIESSTSDQTQRRLFSGLHSMYAFASLLSPILAAGFFQYSFSWQMSFQFISYVPLVIFFMTFFVRPKVESFSLERSTSSTPWLIKRQMIISSLIIALFMAAEVSLSSRLVLFVRRQFELSPQEAPKYLTLFFVSLLVGRLIFTFFSFRKYSNVFIMVASLLSSMAGFLGGLYWSPWLLSLCGLFMAPFFPICADYIMKRFQEKSSEAIAMAMAIGSLVVVVMHAIVGQLTDHFNIQQALLIGPLSLVVVLFLILWQQKCDQPVLKPSPSR